MRTPVFNKKIQYIVKNPRWNVPASIYKNEYAHKSESYLRKRGFAYNSEGIFLCIFYLFDNKDIMSAV